MKNFQMIKSLAVDCISNKWPFLLVGTHGLGKSTLFFDIAESLKMSFLSVTSSYWDLVDAKGIPAFSEKLQQAFFSPIGKMKKALETKEKTLLFFDDLIQAPISIQTIIMPIIQDREINGFKIPDCVSIVAATNRAKTTVEEITNKYIAI
jgi:MoxR-like ATPase